MNTNQLIHSVDLFSDDISVISTPQAKYRIEIDKARLGMYMINIPFDKDYQVVHSKAP